MKAYIISEIGSNHNGSIKQCKKLIKYQNNQEQMLLSSRCFHLIHYFQNLWNERLKKDVDKYSLNIKEWKHKYCRKIKIDIGASAFSIKEAAENKSNINIDFFKIASCDCNYYDLIEYLGKTKPLILSTGLSTFKEIKKLLGLLKTKNKKLVILHCVSNYPPKIQIIWEE